MRLLTTTLILALTYCSCFSQTHQVSEKIGFKENLDNTTFLFSFNNKANDKACLLMSGKELVKGFIINDSGKILDTFNFVKSNKKILPIGGYFEDDKVSILFARNTSDENMFSYSYTFSGEKIDSSIVETDFGKSSVLSVINTGDNILFVCADKKQPQIFLYQIANGKVEQSQKYDLVRWTICRMKRAIFIKDLKNSIANILMTLNKSHQYSLLHAISYTTEMTVSFLRLIKNGNQN